MKRIHIKNKDTDLYTIEVDNEKIVYVYSKSDADKEKYLGRGVSIKDNEITIHRFNEVYQISLIEEMAKCTVCGCAYTIDEMGKCVMCGDYICGEEDCTNYAYGDPQEDASCKNCE